MSLCACRRIAGISVALLMLGSLLAPSAAATSGYYLTVTAHFGSSQIPVGGSTSLTITIAGNISTSDFMGSIWQSPSGLSLSNGGGTCPYYGLYASRLVGEQSPDSNGDISCQLSATVTGVTAGTYAETFEADAYTQGGNFDGVSGTDNETLEVIAPPTITASFDSPYMPTGQTDGLTFDITNPGVNTIGLTGVGFTSTLPSGLTVASSTSTVCGGTLTVTSPHLISLTGASIDSDSDCQVQLDVTGATVGPWGVTTSQVSSVEGGNGTAASTTVRVLSYSPPTIHAHFGTSHLQIGGTTTLTFTVTNPNAAIAPISRPAVAIGPHDLTGVGFTDTLPSGLVVATPNGLTGSCGGGAISATAGGQTISLSDASLAAGTSCTFSLTVEAVANGVQTDRTGPVDSDEAGAGTSSTATITVGNVTPPPTSVGGPAGSAESDGLLLVVALMISALSVGALVVRRHRTGA